MSDNNSSILESSLIVVGDCLLKLPQIIGDEKRGLPPIIPVSKSLWWEGVKSGRYPKPIKLGGETTGTFWRASDIKQLIAMAN